MDPRDAANVERKWHGELNEAEMVAEATLYDEDGDEVAWSNIPFKYEVCDLCNGRGKHVNPSVDRNGLSSDDFDQDPDFREEYFNGAYDVSCYKCGGSRVMVVFDEERANDKIKKKMKDHFSYLADIAKMDRDDAYTRMMENGGYY